MEIFIVGLGGIGSVLSNSISRYINSKILNGNTIINLIDGDSYEPKNFERQEFINFGNKATVKKIELEGKFSNIIFQDFPDYINESNIDKIIKENSVVFIAVDNHKTRKLISDFSKSLNEIIIISGGNEITDGNVQITIKRGGEFITPCLTDYHPEIDNPDDKSPDEMSCEELSQSKPQLYFTNFMVAAYMCAAFFNVIERDNKVISEVYFDLLTMNSHGKIRVPKTKK